MSEFLSDSVILIKLFVSYRTPEKQENEKSEDQQTSNSQKEIGIHVSPLESVVIPKKRSTLNDMILIGILNNCLVLHSLYR